MTADIAAKQGKRAAPILQNAFYILGVTPRDSREKIVAAAEDRGLLLNPEACEKARSDLTNPRNRLAVEISWLPGVTPKRAEKLINITNPESLFGLEDLPPLAQANLVASALAAMDRSHADWSGNILSFARVVGAIDVAAVRSAINTDREIAGFPIVKSVEQVGEALTERRRDFVATVSKALQDMPSRKLLEVMVEVAGGNTHGGTRHPDLVVDELADAYEIGVRSFLTREAANFDILVERIKAAVPEGESAVLVLAARLEKITRNWCAVAKPLIFVASAKGVQHALTHKMADKLRAIALFLFNQHDMLAAAQQLSRLGALLFSSLPGVGETFQKDLNDLDELERRKSRIDLVEPFIDRCANAIKQSTEKPKTAVDCCQSLLGAFPDILDQLKISGAPQSEQAEFCDAVAKTLLHCAIEQCSSMSRIDEAVALLEEAVKIAKSSDVIDTIRQNLIVAKKNLILLSNIEPINSAPSLSSVNGIGFTVYGCSDPDRDSGSYMTTYYFIFLTIPLFPIRRYRVIRTGNSYRFLGKARLRTFDKCHLALFLFLLAIILFH